MIAVVFHGTFAEQIEHIRAEVPRIRTWLWVDDGSGPCPEWAIPYEDAAAAGTDDNVVGEWGRSGDHLLLLYTGGTTGMPKGVMWRQDDLFGVLDANNKQRMPPEQDLDAVRGRITKAGPKNMPAAPLMHGTGLFNVISNLMVGGSVTTMVGRHFSAEEFLDSVQEHGINSTAIVGDAFAKPILRALDAEPDRWDISTLRVIVSSGVMWSKDTKDGLLRPQRTADHGRLARLERSDRDGDEHHLGRLARARPRSSRSAPTLASSPTTTATSCRDPANSAGSRCAATPRSATTRTRPSPRQTFVTIDGERYSIPGDYATVDADGAVVLLGRGSQCINTGGEKVYPEEVEECLKLHPTVADAAVVGLPDEKLGEAITALVEPHAGDEVDERGPDRPRQATPRRLQGTQAHLRHRHDRTRRQRQTRLQASGIRGRRPRRRLTSKQ